MAPLMKVLYR